MTTNEETAALIAEATAHIDNTLTGIGTDESSVRAAWARGEGSDDRFSLLVRLRDRLANALESRQPSEDGKYILRLIETIKQTGGSVEIHGVKIVPCDEYGRTAAVPDAATELRRGVTEWAKRFIPGDRWDTEDLRDLESALNGNVEANPDRRRARSERAEAERDAAPDGQVIIPIARIHELRAAKDAALDAVARVREIHRPTMPGYGPKACVHDGRSWPCQTIAALDGAPKPETLELFPGTNAALDRLTVCKAAPAEAFCIEHGNFHAVELGDPTCEFEDGFGEPVEGVKP